MQDGKALQAGTSHFLGQNFAKAFDVKYLNQQNKEQYVWATSWGVSTRLMGALVMAHSDDDGLVLPPKLAPIQVVIVPIPKANGAINDEVEKITIELKKRGISFKYDKDKKKRPGFKFAEYEMLGVPVRLAIGKRDLENGTIEVARRDTKEKFNADLATIVDTVEQLLEDIQQNIFQKALDFRAEKTTEVNSWDEFKEVLETKGGFLSAHWDGTAETEEKIKEATKATIRCIPNDQVAEDGVCVFSGKPSKGRVMFAKAY